MRSSVPPTFQKPCVTPWGRRHEAPRARAEDLLPHPELGLALEDVERVDVVSMAVRVDPLEVGAEAQLDHLVLGQLGEHTVMALATRHVLPAFGPECGNSVSGHPVRVSAARASRLKGGSPWLTGCS